jgi:hypothetical protein
MGKAQTTIRIDEEVLTTAKEHVRETRGEKQFSEFAEDLLVRHLNTEEIADFEDLGVSQSDFDDIHTTTERLRTEVNELKSNLEEQRIIEGNTDDESFGSWVGETR